MDVQPVLRFLNSIVNVWKDSNNEEGRDRAEKLSQVLKKGKINSQKWESDMKCEAPEELAYMNISKKSSNPVQCRRGSLFPEAISSPSTNMGSSFQSSTQKKIAAPKDVKNDLELSSFSQR